MDSGGTSRSFAAWRCAALWGLVLLLPAITGCRAIFRHPAEPYTSKRPRQDVLLQGMNPFILTNLVTRKLVVEIDWVEGHAPDARAVAGFEEALRDLCPEGKELVVRIDDEIPLESWEAAPGDFLEKAPQLKSFVDGDPDNWAEEELIYIVFVPGRGELLGWATEIGMERESGLSMVTTLFLFPEKIRQQAQLWVGPWRVERAVLIHEIGHVLGLVSHPDHQEKGNPRHCTEPQCVMAHQRLRTQLYNALPAIFAGRIPDRYGPKCRADLATAKRVWSERAAADPAYVDRLRNRREVRELREQACWYGERERWAEAVLRFNEARERAERYESPEPGVESLTDDERFLKIYRFCPDRI